MSVGRVGLACVLAMTFGAAQAAEPPLCRNTEYINQQFAPTAAIARAIYKAVGRGLSRNFLKRYPILLVTDAGDHWNVSQADGRPAVVMRGKTLYVTMGGGQLSMDIDKCIGAVSNASFAR